MLGDRIDNDIGPAKALGMAIRFRADRHARQLELEAAIAALIARRD